MGTGPNSGFRTFEGPGGITRPRIGLAACQNSWRWSPGVLTVQCEDHRPVGPLLIMGFAERIAVGIFRPFYKRYFERPLWWFLSKVKDYFFADSIEATARRSAEMEARLRHVEAQLDSVQSQLSQIGANDMAKWSAIEELVLGMLRQRDWQSAQSERVTASPTPQAISRVNGSPTTR